MLIDTQHVQQMLSQSYYLYSLFWVGPCFTVWKSEVEEEKYIILRLLCHQKTQQTPMLRTYGATHWDVRRHVATSYSRFSGFFWTLCSQLQKLLYVLHQIFSHVTLSIWYMVFDSVASRHKSWRTVQLIPACGTSVWVPWENRFEFWEE